MLFMNSKLDIFLDDALLLFSVDLTSVFLYSD